MSSSHGLRYPSVEWFQALGDEMEADLEQHRRIGPIDLSMIWTDFEGPDGDTHHRLRFEEFALVEITEVDDDFDPESVDFILEAHHDDWRDIIAHLVEHGKPQREFTLNYLTLPGTPVRCWSPDPLGRDTFFRFNQSLQVVVNAASRLPTDLEAPTP